MTKVNKLAEKKLIQKIKDAERNFLFEVKEIKKERDEILKKSKKDKEKNEIEQVLKEIKQLS